MHIYLDCIPCLMNQALRASRLATDNEKIIKAILDEVGLMIKDIPMDNLLPKTALRVYCIIEEITGNPDPCQDLKNQHTCKALELYPTISISSDAHCKAGSELSFGKDNNHGHQNTGTQG